MDQYKNITIIRPGGLGDTILTIPVLQELRRLQPQAKISLFTHLGGANLLKDCKLVDQTNRQGSSGDDRQYSSVIEIMGRMDPGYTEQFKHELKKRLYFPDLLIMWSTDPVRASFALESMGIPKFVVENWQPPEETHQSEFMINTLRNAGIMSRWQYQDDIASLELSDTLQKGILPSAFHKMRSVVIAPGAGGVWKRWPIERYQELVRQLNKQSWNTFIIEGPEERKDNYKQKFPESFILRDLSVKQLAMVMNLKMPFIGNDSGSTHLASAFGCPTLALFFSTTPQQWAPLGKNSSIIRNCDSPPNGACRVCFDPKCTETISVDEVIDAFEELEKYN